MPFFRSKTVRLFIAAIGVTTSAAGSERLCFFFLRAGVKKILYTVLKTGPDSKGGRELREGRRENPEHKSAAS